MLFNSIFCKSCRHVMLFLKFLHFLPLINSTFVCFYVLKWRIFSQRLSALWDKSVTWDYSVYTYVTTLDPGVLLMSVMWLSKQVSFVQYSDDAKTELRLNAYQDKGVAMSSLYHIPYRGGNTKTGAITHLSQWVSQSVSELFIWQLSSVEQEERWNTPTRRPFPLKMEWGEMSPR